MLYELVRSLRTTKFNNNTNCSSLLIATMEYETELMIMGGAVGVVITLVTVIMIIVLCQTSELTDCESTETTSISTSSDTTSGKSSRKNSMIQSPESGFIDDCNLLQVPEYVPIGQANEEQRVSFETVAIAASWIMSNRNSEPQFQLPVIGKPILPELE